MSEIPHRTQRPNWFPKAHISHEPGIRRSESSHDIAQSYPSDAIHKRQVSAQSTPKRQRDGSNAESCSPLERHGSPAKQVKTASFSSPQLHPAFSAAHFNPSASPNQRKPAYPLGHQRRDEQMQMATHLATPTQPATSSILTGVSASQLDARNQQEARQALLRCKNLYDDMTTWKIIRQPISQTITQPQLAAEVKAIYHALVQIEAKCVNIVSRHFALLQEKLPSPTPLRPEEWQHLIALHRTLLHEHHDFFLASQHPSSSSQLRDIASKYSMPARMWKHGIHNFLELLRRHLPHSMEWMLAFIYLAYQMVALLFETVPSYEETWIECLGDLGRYRMAIEEEDPKDREIWTGVARLWYCKAVDKAYHVGRLYHHLAILARSNAVEQLSLYARSLHAIQTFNSSMSSILTLLEPMAQKKPENDKPLSNEIILVQVHATIFFSSPFDSFMTVCNSYKESLGPAIVKSGPRWRDSGCWKAICIATAITGWGMRSTLKDAYEGASSAAASTRTLEPLKAGMNPTVTTSFPQESQEKSFTLARVTLEVVLSRPSDVNILPFTYVILIFIFTASRMETGQKFIKPWVPWEDLSNFLNVIMRARDDIDSRLLEECNPFEDSQRKPIFEDYQVRGQIWAPDFLSKGYFGTASYDEDDRRSEDSETHRSRLNRILHLGKWIASTEAHGDPWLDYNRDTLQFSVK